MVRLKENCSTRIRADQIYTEQYHEWFYVNKYTKKSQWDRPTEPVYGPPGVEAPAGPPPAYAGSHTTGPEKGAYGSNNPFGSSTSVGGSANMTEDERLARKLQEEENARSGGSSTRGAADSFYGAGGSQANYGQGQSYGQGQAYGQPQSTSPYGQQQSSTSYAQQDLPARDQKKGGFLSKLMGKSSSSQPHGYGQGYPQQQQPYYQQGPPPGQYGGYPQQQYYQQPPKRHGGLGAGGGAALGLGGGLLGGMMLGEAMGVSDEYSKKE